MKNLLNKFEKNSIDSLLNLYGGPESISEKIKNAKKLENRIEKLRGTDWLQKVEYVQRASGNLSTTRSNDAKIENLGEATIQVSGFQGAEALYQFIKENEQNGFDQKIPAEMISVVGLTDHYVKHGDLLATLAIAENILQVKRFCSTSLVTVPLKKSHLNKIENIANSRIEYQELDSCNVSPKIVNQGTFFGNLAGIEVANKNYLIYLDNIIQTAIETGATFFLSPSWNTIITGCYLGQILPEIKFKVSCFLGIQSTLQFKILLNIIKQFLLPDGTSPIVEINLGNGANYQTVKECFEILKAENLESIDLATHIKINNDLGAPDYDWFENAEQLLKDGHNLTLKYESASVESSFDQISTYFVDDKTRFESSEQLGKILYLRTKIANEDAKKLTKQSIRTIFAGVSK
jgi:hypothetical protein